MTHSLVTRLTHCKILKWRRTDFFFVNRSSHPCRFQPMKIWSSRNVCHASQSRYTKKKCPIFPTFLQKNPLFPIFPQKSPVCAISPQKSPVFPQNSPLPAQKPKSQFKSLSCNVCCVQPSRHAKIEPCIPSYLSAKESCISAKKRPIFLQKSHTLPRKSPMFLQKIPVSPLIFPQIALYCCQKKSSIFPQKRPIVPQKSPVFSVFPQKSPVFPIFLQRSSMFPVFRRRALYFLFFRKRALYFYQTGPYIFVEEPCIPAKEP